MNVVRLNFSHGDFAEHQVKVDNLRKAFKKNSRETIRGLFDLVDKNSKAST
jgi:pyruvate kinase